MSESDYKIIAFKSGFVAKRIENEQVQYFDASLKWIDSFGGPPETLALKPFATKESVIVSARGGNEPIRDWHGFRIEKIESRLREDGNYDVIVSLTNANAQT